MLLRQSSGYVRGRSSLDASSHELQRLGLTATLQRRMTSRSRARRTSRSIPRYTPEQQRWYALNASSLWKAKFRWRVLGINRVYLSHFGRKAIHRRAPEPGVHETVENFKQRLRQRQLARSTQDFHHMLGGVSNSVTLRGSKPESPQLVRSPARDHFSPRYQLASTPPALLQSRGHRGEIEYETSG